MHGWQWCSRHWHVHSKMPGCCSLSDKGNEILFRINISLPLIIMTGLDGVGQWPGLPGHRTTHHWTSSYEATLKPWFIFCQLILKRILLPVSFRQQQPDIFERTRQSLEYRQLCIQVVAICLNICSKLLWNTTFFRILQWFCLISNLSQTQFDSP